MSDFGFTPTAIPQAAMTTRSTPRQGPVGSGAHAPVPGHEGSDSGFAQFILDALNPDASQPSIQLLEAERPGETSRPDPDADPSTTSAPEESASTAGASSEDQADPVKSSAEPDPAAMVLAAMGLHRWPSSTAPEATRQTQDTAGASEIARTGESRGRSRPLGAKPRADAPAGIHSKEKTEASHMAGLANERPPASQPAMDASASTQKVVDPGARSVDGPRTVQEAPTAQTLTPSSLALALPSGAAEVPGPTGSLGSTTPMDIQLSPGLDRPEFKSALGVQVAVLVRQGVEQARLQLNPAEMGPVAIRLQKQGQEVRVDLAADLAQTRQVLEQSLPALAQALKEAGFTLAGGGVQAPAAAEQGLAANGNGQPGGSPSGFSQGDGSRQPGQPEVGTSASNRLEKAGLDGENPTLASLPRGQERVVGLVDLYA